MKKTLLLAIAFIAIGTTMAQAEYYYICVDNECKWVWVSN